MKILVSCLSKSWGGMEMYVISSIKLLLNDGNKVYLACIKGSQIEKSAENLPVEITAFDSGSVNIKNLSAAANLLKTAGIDLIHTHFSKDLWLIVPVLRFLKLTAPLIMTKHLGSAVTKKDMLHRFLYQRVNHAIAISNVIKENLLETTPLDSSRVSVIHNFVDLDKYRHTKGSAKLKSEFGIDDDTVVLGMVGRITPGKGHEDVIDAVNIIRNRSLSFKIIIAGSASDNEKEFEQGLKEKIRALGLEEIFIFTGFRKDIPELLGCFDVFLFPSRAEAFGLALVEAMAAGVANIACYSDGVKDIAVKGFTSLTYDKGDINSLAEGIASLAADEDLRSRLAKNSYEWAERFNAGIFQEKIRALYKSCLPGKGRL